MFELNISSMSTNHTELSAQTVQMNWYYDAKQGAFCDRFMIKEETSWDKSSYYVVFLEGNKHTDAGSNHKSANRKWEVNSLDEAISMLKSYNII
jgi:hypothetical protein